MAAMKVELLKTTDKVINELSGSNELDVIRECLRTLAELAPVNVVVIGSSKDTAQSSKFNQNDSNIHASCLSIIKLIRNFSHHHDPRIRTSALLSFLRLNDRGVNLDISLYSEFCEALNDDYERCRLMACRLLVATSKLYKDCLVFVSQTDEQVRLEDDAFSKICTMMTDPSVEVRTEAARLLAEMKTVSPTFLHQTLDKKLMSNLRKKKSAHERGREAAEAGEWSTGQKWADDAPKEFICPDTVNLVNIGSCGAFVHGLEDELSDVRMASLESLCQLAQNHAPFAEQSMDFIVDMFNDEIEEIRLKAIQCLTVINRHNISLRHDQVEIILSVLEDFSMDIREALHEMLASSRLSSAQALQSCIDSLSSSLKKYPQDRISVFKCFQNLGLNNALFVQSIVNELLAVHPYLNLPEQSLDDQNYIASLILVFNAASKCSAILDLLESHTLQHYTYLCDTQPNFVPNLLTSQKLSGGSGFVRTVMCRSESQSDTSFEFFISLFERLRKALKSEAIKGLNSENLSDLDPNIIRYEDEKMIVRHLTHHEALVQDSLMDMTSQDLDRFGQIEPDFRAATKFFKNFIQCLLILRKLLSQVDWINTFLPSRSQSSIFTSSLQNVLNLTFSLVHKFHKLNSIQKCCIQQIRIKALAIQLIAIINSSNASALDLCESFLEEIETLKAYLSQEPNLEHEALDSLTHAILEELSTLEQPKPGTVARALQPLLLTGPLVLEQVNESLLVLTDLKNIGNLRSLVTSSATIHEPIERNDSAYKFTAGLVLALPLDAMIENIVDKGDVRIKVVYPNRQAQIVVPVSTHFRLLSQNEHCCTSTYRLYSSVNICHTNWTEASQIELSLILDYRDNQSSAIDLALHATNKTSGAYKCCSEESQTIELCQPIRLKVKPQNIRW